MQKFFNKFPRSLRPHVLPLGTVLATLGTYLLWLFVQMLRLTPAGLVAGHVHVWGDWSLHVGMANIFAYKPVTDWFAYHPYYADGKFTYGFLTNMIAGLLVRTGIPYTWAFIGPSIVLVVALLVGMYAAYYQLTRGRWTAATAVGLFFLSSGPGWWRWLNIWLTQPERTWQSYFFPAQDVTRIEAVQWLAGNYVNGMLIPQRAFLLGMTLACWSLAGLVWSVRAVAAPHHAQQATQIKWVLVVSGLLAGLLPIAHMHSLIALVMVTGLICVVHWRRWRWWAWYVAPAGILSALLFKSFIAGGIENPEFMKLAIGWTVRGQGWWQWLSLWWEIWGLFSVVMIAGLVLVKKASRSFQAAWLGFTVLFIFGNVVLMQPVEWDNSKLFLWTYFGWSSVVAMVLQRLWSQSWAHKTVALILVVNLTTSGLIELARLSQVSKNSVIMSNAEDFAVGEWVRAHTDTQARFLTNTAHNHPVMMWGVRPILMGYPTWVWNFGFEFDDVQSDIKAMYEGSAATPFLLDKHGVDYVVIGPGERFDQQADQQYFEQQYPNVFATEHYTIYDVRTVRHK